MRRLGFWQGFADGLALGPLWRWLACKLGWHEWWHLTLKTNDAEHDLCVRCGKTRPAKH